MRAYSMDLRERVLKDCDAGMKTAAVAEKYSVSPAWVRRLKQRRAATGEVAPRQQRHGRLAGWVAHAEPSGTRSARPPTPRSTNTGTASHLPLSRVGPGPGPGHPRPDAKKKSLRASEQDRPGREAKRDEWKAEQPRLDSAKVWSSSTKPGPART